MFLHFARALSRKPGACFQTRVPRRAARPACAGAASVCAAKFSAPCVCARALLVSAKAEAARRGAGRHAIRSPAIMRARQRMLCFMGRVLQSTGCVYAPRPGHRRIRGAGAEQLGAPGMALNAKPLTEPRETRGLSRASTMRRRRLILDGVGRKMTSK